VYLGPAGVLTGSARAAQEANEKASETVRREEIGRKKRELKRKSKALEAQITALHSESEAVQEEVNMLTRQEEMQEGTMAQDRVEMGRLRKSDVSNTNRP